MYIGGTKGCKVWRTMERQENHGGDKRTTEGQVDHGGTGGPRRGQEDHAIAHRGPLQSSETPAAPVLNVDSESYSPSWAVTWETLSKWPLLSRS